jgi:hypothetical protein
MKSEESFGFSRSKESGLKLVEPTRSETVFLYFMVRFHEETDG